MLAEIVTIGDELCRGEIVDTNSTWFAEKLWELDISTAWMTSCRDVEADMLAAFELAVGRVDVVVVSGGLGATEDDLTVDVVSKLVGRAPIVDEEARARWLARYQAAGRAVNDKTERQLRVPGKARVHRNAVGAAPGFEVEVGGVPIICMPGIPREVHSIWSGSVHERLRQLRDQRGTRDHIARKTFRAFGRGESDISTMLDGLLDDDGAAATQRESIHYRVKFPEILIKLVVRRDDPADARARLDVLEAALRERLEWLVFGVEDESLAGVVGAELSATNRTVSVAESCTGGLLGGALTDVPGSSAYFLGGVITYSNAAKVKELGVSEATLEEAGAVSEACALEMAVGVRRKLSSDFGVAVTGIAGPGGGSDEKPVGTVWLAVASEGGAVATRMQWPGPREQVRRLAVFRALAFLRRQLGGQREEQREEQRGEQGGEQGGEQ